MSIFSAVGGILKTVGKTALGTALGTTGALILGGQGGSPPPQLPPPGGLPALPGAGGGLPGVGRAGLPATISANMANYSAGIYCRRHPQWCVQVGGIGNVAQLVAGGQLPRIKRRRRRGITPKDLQSFRRVANLIKAYSAPVRRMRTPTRKRRY